MVSLNKVKIIPPIFLEVSHVLSPREAVVFVPLKNKSASVMNTAVVDDDYGGLPYPTWWQAALK